MLLHATLESLRSDIAASASVGTQERPIEDTEAEFLNNALTEDIVQYDVTRLQKLVRTIYSMEQSAEQAEAGPIDQTPLAKEA